MVEVQENYVAHIKWGGGSKECVVEQYVKASVRRKKAAWKEVLAASNEEAKERCMGLTKKKREKLTGVYIKAKNKNNK